MVETPPRAARAARRSPARNSDGFGHIERCGQSCASGGTFTFNEGATVYDALCALGLSVNAHGSSYGTYVSAIGGLAEKQYGGTSGWMYSVNGTTPMTACSNYVLSNGDNVVWYYVTG